MSHITLSAVYRLELIPVFDRSGRYTYDAPGTIFLAMLKMPLPTVCSHVYRVRPTQKPPASVLKRIPGSAACRSYALFLRGPLSVRKPLYYENFAQPAHPKIVDLENTANLARPRLPLVPLPSEFTSVSADPGDAPPYDDLQISQHCNFCVALSKRIQARLAMLALYITDDKLDNIVA